MSFFATSLFQIGALLNLDAKPGSEGKNKWCHSGVFRKRLRFVLLFMVPVPEIRLTNLFIFLENTQNSALFCWDKYSRSQGTVTIMGDYDSRIGVIGVDVGDSDKKIWI